ncbi:MAG TPA: RhuM family protein, partial [Holophagaceae bacterium]|nr:RhuM family protein [Holophagaceae bacterium]
MGLKTWKGAKPRKADALVAKNYLGPEELSQLNLIVEQYLSFAELQARSRKPMTMQAWSEKLHGFLTLNDREILKDAGHMRGELAKELAAAEYEKFDAKRRIETLDDSEFDRQMKRVESLGMVGKKKGRK